MSIKSFNDWKYWLDLNEHIKECLALLGLLIAIVGITLSSSLKLVGIVVSILIGIVVIFQFILGIWKMKLDTKEHIEHKRQQQLEQTPKKQTKV